MQIYILKNKKKLGPLELEEVRALLANGKLVKSDRAWHEGAEHWVPLSSIPEAMSQPKATTAAKPSIQKTSRPAPTQPMSSVGRDVKNLKANTSTTTAEVRSFLKEMQGKSPREMLGVIAQSSLFTSLLHSTAIICALLFGFTGLVIALEDEQVPGATKAAQPNIETEAKEKDNAKTLESEKDDNRTSEEKAAEKMGVDKTKKGQPKEVNPFGNKPGDDILGEIDK